MRLLVVCLLLAMQFSTAQNSVLFGRVSTAELRETKDSVFGDIAAKVIYKRFKLDYGSNVEIHERIKIYNKEGLEYSNWEILYDDISNLQAYTYNLENGVIEKTHVTKESIFKENLYGDYEVTKITFPNVKEGAVIELKYTINIGRWSSVAIQKQIPIKSFRLVIQNAQKWMDFKQNPNFPLELVQEENDNDNLVVFTGKDIPAIKSAPYVNNLDNYKGKLYIRVRNEKDEENWGKLTNELNRAFWFGRRFNSKPFLKKEVEKIIEDRTDSLDMAKDLFAYVKDRMEYNNGYGLGSYDLKDLYKAKKGDKSDINMLLTYILRWAGFKADPMIVACKHKGEVLFAEMRSYNATLSALQIGEQFYLLDASETYGKFGQIPIDLMNGYGLIVRKDGTSISYPTISTQLSVSRSSLSVELDIENNVVKGSVMNQFTDYLAWSYRDTSEDEEAETISEALEEGYDLLAIENFTEKDIEDPNKPVVISYDFSYENAIEEINGDVYVAPFLFLGQTENDFTEEERRYPVDIEYPYLENYSINFTIPEGYKVVSLPKGKRISIEDEVGSLVYICSASDTNIQVGLTVKLNYAMIPVEYYGALQSLFSEYVEISKSKIVLTKL